MYSAMVRCIWGSNGEIWGKESIWKTQTLPGVRHDLRQEYHGVHSASMHTIIKHIYKHITTVLPYVTGIKNQTLQGRDYRMSEILKSGIIFSINKLLHILRVLTLQFPMKTVLHIKFRLRSQTGYMWWTMQLLFVLCEYWPQDKLNMGWKILSLHLEELTILINSVLAGVTHPCARLRHKMEYLS